jgi:hypothetical protein
MGSTQAVKPRIYARAVIAIALISEWILSAVSGFILWLAPEGRQAGQEQLLFGITKQAWGDIHFWISIAALVITILHIVIDWKALRGVLRYLTSVHRDQIARI